MPSINPVNMRWCGLRVCAAGAGTAAIATCASSPASPHAAASADAWRATGSSPVSARQRAAGGHARQVAQEMRQRPLGFEPQRRRRQRRERPVVAGVMRVDLGALGRPVRLDLRAEIRDRLDHAFGRDEIRIAPRRQHAAGHQHALAFGEEPAAIEPVQRLRDRDQLHAGVGQRGVLAGLDRQRDVARGVGRAVTGPMLRDLLRARIARMHVGETRGQSARGLAAAAAGFPDVGRARHDGGDARRTARRDTRGARRRTRRRRPRNGP